VERGRTDHQGHAANPGGMNMDDKELAMFVAPKNFVRELFKTLSTRKNKNTGLQG
jgi:hypothetical protein